VAADEDDVVLAVLRIRVRRHDDPVRDDLEGARELLLEGTARPVRLLLANERPFLLWAGTGLDARIMGNTRPALKRWLGRTGIFFTVAFEFFRYEFPRLEVTIDGVAHAATFAVICHARHYAGDWVIAPEASVDAEEMDVLLFSGRGRWKFLSLFRQIQLGKSGHLSRGLATIMAALDMEAFAVPAAASAAGA